MVCKDPFQLKLIYDSVNLKDALISMEEIINISVPLEREGISI